MSKDNKLPYRYESRFKNPLYEAGLKLIHIAPSLRSCLRHANDDKLIVKNEPKWITTLVTQEFDLETGEIDRKLLRYDTNEIKSSNQKKIKALDKFCNHYQPLYRSRKVSMFFITFTRANYASESFRRTLDLVRKRFSRFGYPVRGFVWTAEVSTTGHWHYHLCIATDRMHLMKIPKALKFNSIWGQRTGIEFVKKNVKHYMAKYFAKHNARVIGTRSFGVSRKFL